MPGTLPATLAQYNNLGLLGGKGRSLNKQKPASAFSSAMALVAGLVATSHQNGSVLLGNHNDQQDDAPFHGRSSWRNRRILEYILLLDSSYSHTMVFSSYSFFSHGNFSRSYHMQWNRILDQ